MQLRFGLLIIVSLLNSMCLDASAQTSVNVSLHGYITNIKDAAVVGATATLTNTNTSNSQATTAGEDGSGGEASDERLSDSIQIGKGKSFKLVTDKDRIWVLSPQSRPDGDQDLILYELDPISLRPLSSERVNPQPGSVRLSGEGLLLQSPDGRTLYAFWNEPDTRRQFANRLMFSAFDKATRKWKAPITVNDDHAATTHSFQGAIAGPDGTIHVAWIDRRHNSSTGAEGYPGGGDGSRGIEPSASLYYTRSLDGGSTFEKNRYIAGLVCACCQIAVGFSKGNVSLAWRSVEPGDIRDIFTTVSSDNGATWAKPQVASRDNWVINGCPHEAPAFASTATALYLAWMTAVSGKREIYMVVSKDGGRTFGERVHVSSGMSKAKHPRLVGIGDRVGIAFEGQIEGQTEPRSTVIYRELDRGRLSSPIAISGDPGPAIATEMAVDHRSLLIGWSQPSGGSSAIHLRRWRTGKLGGEGQ
jgi:hypothetical protein